MTVHDQPIIDNLDLMLTLESPIASRRTQEHIRFLALRSYNLCLNIILDKLNIAIFEYANTYRGFTINLHI
jgi:hypothetical protein